MPERTCPYCGASFTPRMKTQKVCGSPECRQANKAAASQAYAERHRERVRQARYAADRKRRADPVARQQEAENRQRRHREIATLLAGIKDDDLLAECRRRGWIVSA